MATISFEVVQTEGKARLGRLTTPHGSVPTPVFMPVGTAGSIKGVTPDQLRAAGVDMILGNTYHLILRPGAETVARLGGLHAMMGWDGPLLTDSGGYQVFSLAHLRRVDDDGVVFTSHIDGAEVRLTPETAVRVQRLLAPDILMQLDECPPADAPREKVALAVRRSAEWARRCRDAWQGIGPGPGALLAIQQGGVHADLREESARRIVELDLPGYAIGGLSVGEGPQAMRQVLDAVHDQFPPDRPRYLMGVGEPRDILAAVLRGIDMFDCVLPTRNGRNAQAFMWTGRLRLRNSQWTQDTRPLEDGCDCYTCRHFSRGALRHLFLAREMLGPTLVSIHNLRFFARFMGAVRQAIAAGTLAASAQGWIDAMYGPEEEPAESEGGD
jgi:queuine tRNA-ribosyltransferase